MNLVDRPPYRNGDFELSARWDGLRLQLALRGHAELDVNEALGPLLLEGHAEALRLGAREVVVDLGELVFLSTACFKHLVKWLGEVQRVKQQPYTIRFRSNPNSRWQHASLAALSCFAPNLVSIEDRRT